jgi:3-hydroxyisobutyrate dehydrogenase-like beta-hydroxyacid dehydrogenase
MMDIGFIGLGNMGFPMARRLINAGHHVVAYDTRPEVLKQLVALGAVAGVSPQDVASKVETVMSSLPTPAIVRAVALGADGLLHGTKVKRFIEMSTTGSQTAIEVGQALRERGIQMIDSPVSGGVNGAVNGTLAVMVSAPQQDFDLLKPVLDIIGKVFFVGEKPGLAQTMKLVNNYLSATALAVTSEAMSVGAKAGLDPALMISVINAGSGRNSASQDKFPKSILPGTFDFGFTTALMFKDLMLFKQEAEYMHVPTTIAPEVHALWQATQDHEGADSDFTAVAKEVERRVGISLRAKS